MRWAGAWTLALAGAVADGAVHGHGQALRVRLEPANHEMSSIFVDATRAFELLGVVIGVYRRYRV